MRRMVSALLVPLAFMFQLCNTASAEMRGLTGYYHRSADESKAIITGPYDYKTVDPRIDFGTAFWNWTPFSMERQFSVYWNGWIFIDAKQYYRFAALAHGGAEVYIDDIKVVDKPDHPMRQFSSGHLPLSSGYHHIEIIYYNWNGEAGIALMWNRGTGFEVVPSTKLYPEDAINPDSPWPQTETQP